MKLDSIGSVYRKIIVMLCIVNSELYCVGVSMVVFGCVSWMCIMSVLMLLSSRNMNVVMM